MLKGFGVLNWHVGYQLYYFAISPEYTRAVAPCIERVRLLWCIIRRRLRRATVVSELKCCPPADGIAALGDKRARRKNARRPLRTDRGAGVGLNLKISQRHG